MGTYFMRQVKVWTRILSMVFVICVLTFISATNVYAVSNTNGVQGNLVDEIGGDAAGAQGQNPPFELNISSNAGSASLSSTLQMLLILTVLTIAPSILIMVTSFTRILIVLHFVRSALGTQTTPPNQVLIGLALFLTFFVMTPTFMKINTEALQPLSQGTISQEEAIDTGVGALRTFMFEQANPKDIKLFLNIAEIPAVDVNEEKDIPTTVLIPSFIISELRTAFIIGFILYLPFIVIDMVVASILMSMGMMMLPPTTISMPFKILLFIMADGWNLVIGELIRTFYK